MLCQYYNLENTKELFKNCLHFCYPVLAVERTPSRHPFVMCHWQICWRGLVVYFPLILLGTDSSVDIFYYIYRQHYMTEQIFIIYMFRIIYVILYMYVYILYIIIYIIKNQRIEPMNLRAAKGCVRRIIVGKEEENYLLYFNFNK